MLLNENNYTAEQIDRTLRMADGSRNVDFRYELLNRHDIKLGGLDGIERAAITHGEFSAVKRSAEFTLNENFRRNEIDFLTERIQPWFILRMPLGGTVEWPLGVFLLESPSVDVTGSVKRRGIGAYDKGLILEQYSLHHRQHFPAGTNYAAAVEQLLAMAGITKINIMPSGLQMPAGTEFPMGANIREAINELLDAMNYTSLSFDAAGVARSGPYTFPALRHPTIHYSTLRDSVVKPGLLESLDIASCANVFIRVAENLEQERPIRSEFVNNDPQSPISTVRRGRRIVDFGTVREAAGQEALDTFTRRAAVEAAQALKHITFTTVLMPNHGSGDTLFIEMPELLSAPHKFTETGWSMELKTGGTMTHSARMAVYL